MPLDWNHVIESLSWISISTSPLQWMHPSLSMQPDLLIPENPLTYLWWEACFSLSLPLLPVLPFDSKFPDAVTRETNETYLRDAATLCQGAFILNEAKQSWEDAFVQTNKLIVERMQLLLAAKESSQVLSFYKRLGVNWDALWSLFDTTLVLGSLDSSDALYTAQVIASEFMINGLASSMIP